MKFKIKLLITLLSIIGAAIGVFISEVISNRFELPSIIMMGIYFEIPVILAVLGSIIGNIISPVEYLGNKEVFKKCAAVAIGIAIIGAAVIPMGMQYLYEFSGGNEVAQILLIDCSGSMKVSNYDCLTPAFEAAENIIQSLGKKDYAALVCFDNDAPIEIEEDDYADIDLTEMSESNKEEFIKRLNELKVYFERIELNGTDFDKAFSEALDIVGENEENTKYGVFLISDGEDALSSTEADEFKNKNISIYTLNLSDKVNDSLKNLCDETGGIYINSKNAGDILNNMNSLYESYDSENKLLINRIRPESIRKEIRYIAISCTFYILMGFLLMLSYTFVINRKDVKMFYNVLGGIFSAIIMEINNLFIGVYYMAAFVTVFLICPAIVIYFIKEKDNYNLSEKYISKEHFDSHIIK